MHTQTESVLGRVSQQLSHLEKRDWELWVIVSLAGLLVGAGLLAILLPAAFLKQDNIHFEVTVSRPLVLCLVALLALLNTYLISKRHEIRRVREELISRTIQHELVRQQSFTDPLTEIYNRHSLEDVAGRFMSHARRLKKPLHTHVDRRRPVQRGEHEIRPPDWRRGIGGYRSFAEKFGSWLRCTMIDFRRMP